MEVEYHHSQPYYPSVMMKAPMPILFDGKFRDVDWRVKHLEINQAREKRGNGPWHCDD